MAEKYMPNIFKYTNYREFLRDYLDFKRGENSGFSLKVLSDQCGFKARDFILRVIKGTRNLSKSGVYKTSQGLRFNEKEAQYFEDFSQWYHVVLRSLLPVMNFSDDYTAIGKYLNPPISGAQVKQSIALLIKLGLIEKGSKGNYKVLTSTLASGSDIKSTALSLFHKTMLAMASQSIDQQSHSIRDISGITLSVSAGGLKKIKSEILSFREKILAISEMDSKEDRVIQIGIQCFPLTKIGRIS